MEGNATALREILERLDGKVPQGIVNSGEQVSRLSTTGSGWLTNESALPYVLLHKEAYEIASVGNRWLEPDVEYLKVRTTNGKTYLLRYEQEGDVWALETANCPNCKQTLTEKL